MHSYLFKLGSINLLMGKVSPDMGLENGSTSGSSGSSDNTNFNLEKPSGAPGNANLSDFTAGVWGPKQAPEIAQSMPPLAPMLEAPAGQLSRQLDAGFSANDVITTIRDQVKLDDKPIEIAHSIDNIKVVYVDKNNDPSKRISKGDFYVNKDGSLVMPENRDLLKKKELVIEVERDQGELKGPSDVQQKSIDTLIKSLSQSVLDKEGKVEDPQGLISDAVKKEIHAAPAPESHFPEAMQNAMHNMQRFSGGGRGTMDPGDYMPQREVGRLPHESSSQASLKDVIAGFATNGESEPYYAIHSLADRGCGVGRYMLAADLLVEWLNDLFEGCGEPPDAAKLAAKLGKLMHNKELASQCAKTLAQASANGDLKHFLNDLKTGKLKAGDPQAKAAIEKFLPKELQEVAEGQLIDKYSKGGPIEPTKVAMHLLLGHNPTKEDLSKPEYQGLQQAIERLSNISDMNTDNPGCKIDWQDIQGKNGAPSKLMLSIARRAEHVARVMHSEGQCYQGVADSLRSLGIVNLTGNSAYMARNQLASNHNFVKVAEGHLTSSDLHQVLRPGQILVHQPSLGHKHGHIAVFLGYDAQGRPLEASDKVRPLIVRPNTAIFQPKDSRPS